MYMRKCFKGSDMLALAVLSLIIQANKASLSNMEDQKSNFSVMFVSRKHMLY